MSRLQQGHDAYSHGNHREALEHYSAAYEAGESPADALVGRGAVCDVFGRHDEALDNFNRALAVDGRHALAHHCRGTQLLLRGEFREGWEEYRWYYQTADFDKIRPTLPPWDGRQSGQRMLLLSDQGLGDALQFLRYGPRLQESFREVVFEGSTKLFRVVEGNVRTAAKVPLHGIRELYPDGHRASGCDCYAPLSSLPGVFGTFTPELAPRPAAIPLSPRMREAIGKQYCQEGKFKVAIAWRGSKRTPRWTVRDIPPEMFGLLANVPGVHFYSVDMGPTADELARVGLHALTALHDPMNHPKWDLVNTAAVLGNMQLVITCDSVIAHLAGSLQMPVWIVLPYASEWRWGLSRADSDWYPHPETRLYRQPEYGRWEPVFEQMARDLAARAGM
jgi:hypothetical protein